MLLPYLPLSVIIIVVYIFLNLMCTSFHIFVFIFIFFNTIELYRFRLYRVWFFFQLFFSAFAFVCRLLLTERIISLFLFSMCFFFIYFKMENTKNMVQTKNKKRLFIIVRIIPHACNSLTIT